MKNLCSAIVLVGITNLLPIQTAICAETHTVDHKALINSIRAQNAGDVRKGDNSTERYALTAMVNPENQVPCLLPQDFGRFHSRTEVILDPCIAP